MAGVASAAIIEGSLIIGLDDGSIINCGFVQGPQGLKGDPGPMGATGEPGTDGNTIHTVAGTPRNDMGRDGDYAIDNTQWRIYGPKSGGVWGKAKEMLPGPENVLENGRMTAMTGGGGGSTGKPDATDIIVGPNTPNLGDSINGLKQGQLWFDTDQLALYILVLNSNQERVWVITIPADRSALQDQIVGFNLPGGYGTERIDNGATVYNQTTGLWYYYNKPKNQWIDLPPGENLLQLRTFLVQAPGDIDENFEYNQTDRDNFGTNALTYINDAEHAPTTRIVVSKEDLDEFNWSLLLSSIIEGDQLTLLQVEPGDIGLGTDDRSLRTDYLVVGAPTENPESFSFEVEYQQQNEGHNPRFGGFVSIEFQAVVNQTSGTYYQDTAPIDDGSLKPGNLWVESDTLLGHVWTGQEWAQLGDASSTGFNVTTRDVKTVSRDLPFGSDEMRNVVPTDPIDDLLQTQEDVNDFIAEVSTRSIRKVVRTGDNLDFVQNSVGEGYFTHVAKPAGPTPLDPGTLILLQDGGAEATNYAEVENVIMSKIGIGDYANFNTTKVGDYLILQSSESRGAGQYVIDNITDFGGSWDMGVRIVSGRAFGSFPQIDNNLQVRTTRPIFLLPQATQPVVSGEGYMWFKNDDHELYVSTRGDSDPEEQDVPQWVKIGPGEGESGADIHVGNFPPEDPSEGLLWYETYTETLFIYVGGGWKPVVDPIYELDYTALGRWLYKRSGDSDFGGVFRNLAAGGSQPHDSLTEVRVNNTPLDSSGPVIDPNSWEPGQFLSIAKGNDKVIYKITDATASQNYGDLTLEFVELDGSPFSFYVEDRIDLELRKPRTPEELTGDYLPLTGGTVTGNVTVKGQMKVDGGNEFKLQYTDDTTMFRIQPNANQITSKASILNLKSTPGDALGGRAGLEVQVNGENPLAISNSGSYQETLAIYGYDGEAPGGRAKNLWISASGNINLEGNVNAQSFVKGSELRSTKLTSGQSSNLQIYRGSGASEQRKILVGTDSVNFDVSIKLVGANVDGKVNKDIQVLNGTKLFVSDEGGEIITFGGSGAFYRGNIQTEEHIVNKGYVDAAVADNADEDNTKSRLSLGTYTLRTTSGQPSGNATAGELTLWHLDPSEPATTPVQEFKVGGGYGHSAIFALVQDIIEKSLGADNPVVWYFVQGDKEQRMVGQGQGWTTTGTYHSSGTEYSGDVLTGGQEVELFVEADLNYVWQKQAEHEADADNKYVAKSGSTMTGKLQIDRSSSQLFVGKKDNITTSEIYADGTFKTAKTVFANDDLVTKSYVEGRLTDAGGFNPGDRVAKDSSSGVEVGGFYIQNGNIFAKIS